MPDPQPVPPSWPPLSAVVCLDNGEWGIVEEDERGRRYVRWGTCPECPSDTVPGPRHHVSERIEPWRCKNKDRADHQRRAYVRTGRKLSDRSDNRKKGRTMPLITIRIVTPDPDDCDHVTLGYLKWPVVPRVGETFIAHNLEMRADEDKPKEERRRFDEVVFEVVQVIYRADLEDTFGKNEHGESKHQTEYDVEVVVAPPREEAAWEGLKRN